MIVICDTYKLRKILQVGTFYEYYIHVILCIRNVNKGHLYKLI